MKSLKRTLSLVLALVMVLGLFGGISMTAAASDFTDDEEIQYKEAVDVVTGIGAINGYKDESTGTSSFVPQGPITRAEAAKMIAYTAITAQAGELLDGVISSFTDVSSEHWASPSIEYLVKEGAISGPGDGTFRPDETVTGFQALKMLLCVLGYGEKEEYIGTGWDLKVTIDANNAKLTKGLAKDTKLSNEATREQLALFCFNALNADVVTLSPITGTYVPVDGETLGQKVYDMLVLEGIVLSNPGVANTKNTTVDVDTYVYDSSVGASVRLGTAYDFDIETGADLVGHYVRLYCDASDASKGVLPTYSICDLSTVVNVSKAITSTKDWNAAFGTATITERSYTDSNSDPHYIYPFGADLSAGDDKTDSVTVNSSAKTASDLGTYILYKNEIKSYIAAPTYSVTTVKSVKDPTETASGAIKFDAPVNGRTSVPVPKVGDTTSTEAQTYGLYKFYDGIAAKDVVVSSQTGIYTTVVKAEPVTGTVTAFKAGTPNTITMDGTAYKVSSTYLGTTNSVEGNYVENPSATLVNKECTLYLAADGTVVAVTTEAPTSDKGVVFALKSYVETVTGDYGSVSTKYLVKTRCIDMEGNEVIYTVGIAKNAAGDALDADPVGSNLSTANSTDGQMVGVTVANDATLGGELATLSALGTFNAVDTNKQITKVSAAANDSNNLASTATKIGTAYIDSNTKFIFVEGDGTGDVKVSVLSAPQSINTDNRAGGTDYYYYTEKEADNTATVKYVVANQKPSAVSQDNIIFLPSETYTTVTHDMADGKSGEAHEFNVYVDGKAQAIKTPTDQAVDANTFYSYAVNEDGLYELTALTSGHGVGAFTSRRGNTLITATNDATKAANGANLTDAEIDESIIIDLAYIADQAAGGAQGLSQISSMSDMTTDSKLAWTFKTENGKTTVTSLYYLGEKSTSTDFGKVNLSVAGGTAGDSSTVPPLTIPVSYSAFKADANDSNKMKATINVTGDCLEASAITLDAKTCDNGAQVAAIAAGANKKSPANNASGTALKVEVEISVTPEKGGPATIYYATLDFTNATIKAK